MKYILLSAVCLSVFYLGYLLFLRKELRFRHLRYFLLSSMLLALLIPLSRFKIELNMPAPAIYTQVFAPVPKAELLPASPEITTEAPASPAQIHPPKGSHKEKTIAWGQILFLIYSLGVFILCIKLLFHLLWIIRLYVGSSKKRHKNITLLTSTKIGSSFSFFNWIFLSKKITNESDQNKVLKHELIHASQYHSIDIILIELLSAVMWFNPLVWMMRKSVQLVHEYLADEGVINSGVNKLNYQALLLNQATEERLICFSSSFNHSLLKKRIMMMTRNNFNTKSKLRILALVPLAIILIIGVACVNKQKDSDVVTAIQPVKMNVLYLGADNPVNIAVSGAEASELTVSIDNGTIKGGNGIYIIRPNKPGKATVTVSSKGKVIKKAEFRVKVIRDPVAAFRVQNAYKTSGRISKKELLDAGELLVYLPDTDFDLTFKVVSFVMSATVVKKSNSNSMIIREEISHSSEFSELQIDLIKSLINQQKLMIEEITVVGPDGRKRKISPMVFNISE